MPARDVTTIDAKQIAATIRLMFIRCFTIRVKGCLPFIRFNHATRGLKTGDGELLMGFTHDGADGAFVAAEAVIEGETAVVSGPTVPTPVAVRYGWANLSNCNLADGEGLPASPFRVNGIAAQKPPK